MWKTKTYQLIFFVFSALFLFACKKYEVNSNKLANQGSWEVTELRVGNNQHTTLPRWHLEKADIAGEFAAGTWMHANGSSTQFEWRFDNYSGFFEFKASNPPSDVASNKACLQCNNLSGEYKVITDKRKLYEFESVNTSGYGSLPVFIQLKPY